MRRTTLLPRFRIRTLMIAVAVVAILAAAEIYLFRAAEPSDQDSAILVVLSATVLAVWGGVFAGTILWSLLYVARRR